MLKSHIKSKIYILHAVDPLRLIRVKELTKLGCKRGRRVLTVIKGSSESLMFSQTLGASSIYIRHLIKREGDEAEMRPAMIVRSYLGTRRSSVGQN